jgi:mannose-6-phosphate isomerase
MTQPLYPLRFAPVLKTMLWGGRRLRPLLGLPPADEPTGEAWILSDVDGSPSVVANGPLAGRTLRELLAENSPGILGDAPLTNGRFPLLLKMIDARQELSVQVHPTDALAAARVPGANGKTEAWVVLDASPATSTIYAGFRAGTTAASFRDAMAAKTTPATLHSFTPNSGDCVFLRAGTVHAIGADILLFEVQQTSDITYRLYDWDRIDAKTGKGRDLHIDDGLACSDFAAGPCEPVPEAADGTLVKCEYFHLRRHRLAGPTTLGEAGKCRALVCVEGSATIGGERIGVGGVVLLPAAVGTAAVVPDGRAVILECGP